MTARSIYRPAYSRNSKGVPILELSRHQFTGHSEPQKLQEDKDLNETFYSKVIMDGVKEVKLTVNGVEYVVINPGPDLCLTDWLRDKVFLKGVKKLCDEGGCGSCIVAISKDDPLAHPQSIMAVNSCLQPVISLDGYHIITVEGLGSKKGGFHKIQETFAEYFASQCGFCTPGIIMNGFSFLANGCNGRSKEGLEKSLDGNICRCTGYRPILDAMKSFSEECGIADIEDFRRIKCCVKNCVKPKAKCIDLSLEKTSNSPWHGPKCLSDLFAMRKKINGNPIKLAAGNTGAGVFKNKSSVQTHVSLRNVKELNEIKEHESEVEIGAGVTLSKLIWFLKKRFSQSAGFAAAIQHLEKIASIPVRNVATWAGNLMLINKHKHFPSDVFVIFSAMSAKLKIADSTGLTKEYNMEEFFATDLPSMIILSATLPVFQENDVYQSFKIMPRKQNSYGYVNAGFFAALDATKQLFDRKPRLVFGGLGLEMVRATEVEIFLEGKMLREDTFTVKKMVKMRFIFKSFIENRPMEFQMERNSRSVQ